MLRQKKKRPASFVMQSNFGVIAYQKRRRNRPDQSFHEPTIKNKPIFVIKQIRNFCITVECLYHFNKVLYNRKNKTLNFFKQQLRYELGACKNNSQSLRVKNNKFPRRFLLISCYQVARVHLMIKNLLNFQVIQVSEMNI